MIIAADNFLAAKIALCLIELKELRNIKICANARNILGFDGLLLHTLSPLIHSNF